MQKIYFLISIFLFGLTSNLILNERTNQHHQSNISNNINIDEKKYLTLNYNDGQFFAWNQDDSITAEHVVGIYTSDDNKSYFLTSNGVFINLEYQVINFTRINNTTGIAQLASFIDGLGNVWTNKNFIVDIDGANNFIIRFDKPLLTENNNFVVINDNSFFAYGIGLDLITINSSDTTVEPKVAPYNAGYALTDIYLISPTSAIFINDDGQLWYITDILGAFTIKELSIYVNTIYSQNIGVFNDTGFVFRTKNNSVQYYDLTSDKITGLDFQSINSTFFFKVNDDEFVINTATKNASVNFGVPKLIKISDLKNPIDIDGINTISSIIVNSDNQGIMIDGGSLAYNFQLNSDKFTFNSIGNIDSYQFINQNLGFATYQNANVLLSANDNIDWVLQKYINFSGINKNTQINYLNNLNVTSNKTIDYRYTYFANDTLNLNIKHKNLVNVTISSSQGTQTLTPVDAEINYNFTNFINYNVTINFGAPHVFNFKVNINRFDQNKLFNINGSNIINYVGYIDNQLFDVQAINENLTFNLAAFNYDLLQSVQLIRFDTNLVIRSIDNIYEGDDISYDLAGKFILKNFLCALKVENLLNQATYIYLGFIQNNGTKPMPVFWETDQGRDLRKEALLNNYTDVQLNNMNADAINNLLQIAATWKSIKVQATTLAYVIIGIISISSIAAVGSYIYDLSLTKKIKKGKPIRKNKKRMKNDI